RPRGFRSQLEQGDREAAGGGDFADAPRFVETKPRQGYRFIASVEGGSTATAEELPVQQTVEPVLGIPAGSRSRSRRLPAWTAWALLAGVAIGAGITAIGWRASLEPAPDDIRRTRFAGEPSNESNPAFSPDGRSVAYLRWWLSGRELVVRPMNAPTPLTL